MQKLILLAVLILIIGGGAMYYSNNTKTIDVDSTNNIEKIDIVEEISIEDELIGKWQSTDDPKSIIVFAKDRTTTNIYDEQEMSTGDWAAHKEEFNGALGTFLHTVINDEEYEYAVLEITETFLSLSYLPRGNTLNYIRIEEEK